MTLFALSVGASIAAAAPGGQEPNPAPPVLFLQSRHPADGAFVEELGFDFDGELSVAPRPSGFNGMSVTAQADAQAEFFERAPTGLLVWTAAPKPTIYILTSGRSQPNLQVIEAGDWEEARTAFVAVWEDISARYRLGVDGAEGTSSARSGAAGQDEEGAPEAPSGGGGTGTVGSSTDAPPGGGGTGTVGGSTDAPPGGGGTGTVGGGSADGPSGAGRTGTSGSAGSSIPGSAEASTPGTAEASAPGATDIEPRAWRWTVASGTYAALAGGGELSGYLALRLALARDLGAGLRVEAGLEGWPVLFGRSGWGVGPTAGVGIKLPPELPLYVSWTTALLVHRWSAPTGFREPEAQLALRTGPSLAAEFGLGQQWLLRLQVELGLWPFRTVFEVEGEERWGLPTVDAGVSTGFGRAF